MNEHPILDLPVNKPPTLDLAELERRWKAAESARAQEELLRRQWQKQAEMLQTHLTTAHRQHAADLDGTTVARVRELLGTDDPRTGEPPDGSYVRIAYQSGPGGGEVEKVWVRNDRKAGQAWGDWWQVRGATGFCMSCGTTRQLGVTGPASWGEVCGLDDPEPYGISQTLLIPADVLEQALSGPAATTVDGEGSK